jgi:protein O-mannosyl-transferase
MHQWVRRGILCALVVVVVILAYSPALRGGFVWDDDAWTTGISGLLQDVQGLYTMWFHPTALQQYYPLTGTTFWLDHQLWGLWTTPFHVENVLLHALAALLCWRLLRRLQIPGAGLAAALFALHPVMVESVAWITERKNVLSLVLYLGAFLAYLRFAQGKSRVERRESRAKVTAGETPADSSTLDARRSTFFYALALVLFLGALLAKTTTFSLPAAILLVLWWRRGALRWRADVVPTLPFFALAIGLCGVTFWLEKTHVGAQGPDFAMTFPERCLVAGRVFWFYLGKLLWPAELCFVYPRWQPDAGVWWQWLYPAGALGALAALWLGRGRLGRGPLTALLFYVGTLFPVLGFMNVYGTRYSFVWDHWVYLSSLGIFALAAAGVARAAERLKRSAAAYGFAAIVLPVLGVLTWQQAGTYRDIVTLWRATLARNPDCWMAHSNLGVELVLQGKFDEAIRHYERALQLKPEYPEGLSNLGVVIAKQGRLGEATKYLERSIQLKPDYAEAYNNLGGVLAKQKRAEEATQYYARAVQLKPDYPEAHCNLGVGLAAQGNVAEAMRHFERALQLKPDYAEACCYLALALAGQGKSAEAVQLFQRAFDLATAQGNPVLAESIRARLAAYQQALAQPQTP